MDVVIFLAGLILLGIVLWDIFQSIVVPRPTPGLLRLGRYLIPPTWRLWRAIGIRARDAQATDWFLGLYAPGAAILLFVVWLAIIIVADGLMLFALRGEVTPHLGTFFDAMYFAGTSVLTLGFGEIVATGGISRAVVIVAAVTGLGVVALVITFVFSLFANYQRREVLVVTLSARAKTPPSAVTLLETHARLDMVDELPGLFREWERWAAEVLDSHVAYPLLGYFRSSHDSISWISALGAVLDSAALVVTTIQGVPRGQAHMMLKVGAHLVEDISNVRGGTTKASEVDEAGFTTVYEHLARAGYALEPRDRALRAFERVRNTYAGRLEALAAFWATPAPGWSEHHDVLTGTAIHEARLAK
ncbi:MAG TPA: potassium channel family protein [Candidatus Dormibacteraeota bacterium]|nr:potassium channel family protein [Candidatus Dormibacteraeota bacterium]